MALALGCIGDDYTGSSDLANTLTRNGLRTLQLIGVPSAELALPEVDAIVIALKNSFCRRRGCGQICARRGCVVARARRLACVLQDLLDVRTRQTLGISAQ